MRNTPYVKRFTRTVFSDQSVLGRTRFVGVLDALGAVVTAATVQVAANNLTFLVNGVAETVIGTYTGATGAANQIVFVDANIATIQRLIETINGLGVGHPVGANLFRRWRASIADFRPGFAIGAGDGLAAGPTNVLLGDNSEGLVLNADISNLAVANTMSIGVGVPDCRRGSGPMLFDHFESDYVVTTAGVRTPQRNARVQQQQFGAVPFEVRIESIHCGAVFANNDKVIQVFDQDNNLIWGHLLAAANDVPVNVLGENQPIVGTPGSPLWVECAGTGAYTNGPLTVSGWVRVN